MKCIIVDDEFPAREELKYFVCRHSGMEFIAEFTNSIDAFDYLQEHSHEIELIFLDINMPELSGIRLAKIVRKLNQNVKIVFVTAHRDYAVDAFEIQAFDYLLKPYSEERIERLLDRVTQGSKRPEMNKLSIPIGDKIVIVSVEDISVIEADKKESRIYTKDSCYLSKMKISDLEALLDSKKFYRCHRSYIIQLSKVKELENWFHNSYLVHMKDCSIAVPISRNNIKEFKSLFHVK